MDKNDKFCRICGTRLEIREFRDEGPVPYCPSCDRFRFPRFNTAVSMIVINEFTDEMLLVKQYGRTDFILVAGYVNKGESLEDAVIREIKEETGMTVSRMKFNRTRYYERTDTLVCNFTVFVRDAEQINTNYEIDSYKWFAHDEAKINIKPDSLAAYYLNAYIDETDV